MKVQFLDREKLLNFATNDEWLILFMTHSQVERVRKLLRPRQTQVILNFFQRNETGHFLSEKLLNENIFICTILWWKWNDLENQIDINVKREV